MVNSKDLFLKRLNCLSLLCMLHLEIDKIQRRISNVTGPDLGSHLQSHSDRSNVTSMCLFSIYFYGIYSDKLSTLVPRIYESKRNTR